MIRTTSFVMLPALAALALAGCQKQADPISTSLEKKMIVTGAPEDVARFVALQASRKPVLATTPPVAAEAGDTQSTVSIPAKFSAEDLHHTSREALAAGLDYRIEELKTTSTNVR